MTAATTHAADSLIGYVTDDFAEQIGALPSTGIEVALEPGSEIILRIRHSQIDELRVGPSDDGYTAVQLLLKPDATYELYAMISSADESRAPVFDPQFWHRVLWNRRKSFSGPRIFRPDSSGKFQAVR